jgi:hypothetical protein
MWLGASEPLAHHTVVDHSSPTRGRLTSPPSAGALPYFAAVLRRSRSTRFQLGPASLDLRRDASAKGEPARRHHE